MIPISISVASVMSLADIIVLGVVIFFAFYGLKRGALRTLYSILRIYFSFIITILFYEKLALLLQANTGITSAVALIVSFTSLFCMLAIIVWLTGVLVRKRIANPPQTDNTLSRIGGIVLGVLESVLLMSIIIMAIDFYPAENKARSPLEDTLSYKVIKNIAPSIESFTTGPIERLKDISGGETDESKSDKSPYGNP